MNSGAFSCAPFASRGSPLLDLALCSWRGSGADVCSSKFGAQMSEQLLDFERRIIQAMLGADVSDRIGPQMLQSIAWVHPVVLALTCGHAMNLVHARSGRRGGPRHRGCPAQPAYLALGNSFYPKPSFGWRAA